MWVLVLSAAAAGARASVVVGLAATVGWFFAKGVVYPSLHEVYVGIVVSMITYVGVSVATRSRTEAT